VRVVIGVGQLVCRGAKCLGSVWLVRVFDACLYNYYSEFEDCNEFIQFNHLLLPVESMVI